VDLKKLLGLTALGTICDVVPLRGVNRAFVKQGLKVLSANQNMGVKALADVASANPPFTTYHAGFVLGPRINAGGRIGRADMGAELLSTEDTQLAYAHAAELDRVNLQRRQMQDRILSEAMDAAEAQAFAPIIIVAMPDWHPGIIGIVAGRLKDRFMAGGLTMAPDQIEAFRSFMAERLAEDVEAALRHDSTKVDFVLALSAVSNDLMQVIETVGPYGAGNPQPIFAFSNMGVSFAKRAKAEHVRFTLVDNDGASLSGICFRANERCLDEVLLTAGSRRFHAIGQLKPNVWQGRSRIDFHLLDLAPVLD